jgi:hypothetical protein
MAFGGERVHGGLRFHCAWGPTLPLCMGAYASIVHGGLRFHCACPCFHCACPCSSWAVWLTRPAVHGLCGECSNASSDLTSAPGCLTWPTRALAGAEALESSLEFIQGALSSVECGHTLGPLKLLDRLGALLPPLMDTPQPLQSEDAEVRIGGPGAVQLVAWPAVEALAR